LVLFQAVVICLILVAFADDCIRGYRKADIDLRRKVKNQSEAYFYPPPATLK